MAAPMIDPAALALALGATPPSTPTREQAHRDTRAVLQIALQNAIRQVVPVAAPQVPTAQAQAQVAVQQAAAVPRQGYGGQKNINGVMVPWTGGSPTDRLNEPASTKALRSNDISLSYKMEKYCTLGLPEGRRLSPPGSMGTKDMSTTIHLNDWIRQLSHALKETGMDSVFRATIDNVPDIYLLEKWGKATLVNVNDHVAALKANACQFDLQNLQMSEKFLLNSLDNEMLKLVEQELGNTLSTTPTGPDVFRAVIALHSVLNDATERYFISQLQKMKLVDEPGEDVGTFANKIISLGHHINGISETPVSDLHILIYQTFKNSTTPEFALTVNNILSKCHLGQDLAVLRLWEPQLTSLKGMYRDLKMRNEWVALQNVKENTEAQGLVASMELNALKSEVKRLTMIVGNSAVTSGGSTIICHYCGEKGHISPNCPHKPSSKNQGSDADGTSMPEHRSKFNAKQKPQAGESHVKTNQGTTYKWCDTCKKWNSGIKAHLTAEHITRPKATTAVAAGGLAQVGESETSSPSLTFISGYLGQTVVPVKPELTADTQIVTWNVPGDHDAIAVPNGSFIEKEGLVKCEACRQWVHPAGHNTTRVHANNLYLQQERQKFLDLHHRSSPKVAGLVGSITNSFDEEELTNEAKTKREESKSNWFKTDEHGIGYCQICNVPVTDPSTHTQSSPSALFMHGFPDWLRTTQVNAADQPSTSKGIARSYASNRFSALMDDDSNEEAEDESCPTPPQTMKSLNSSAGQS